MAEAESRPRKVGEYERPARTTSMVIGALVFIALIVLAIVFFTGRGERTSAISHEGARYAAIERDSGVGQGWLPRYSSTRI